MVVIFLLLAGLLLLLVMRMFLVMGASGKGLLLWLAGKIKLI
jgi:hypothetical protein